MSAAQSLFTFSAWTVIEAICLTLPLLFELAAGAAISCSLLGSRALSYENEVLAAAFLAGFVLLVSHPQCCFHITWYVIDPGGSTRFL